MSRKTPTENPLEKTMYGGNVPVMQADTEPEAKSLAHAAYDESTAQATEQTPDQPAPPKRQRRPRSSFMRLMNRLDDLLVTAPPREAARAVLILVDMYCPKE